MGLGVWIRGATRIRARSKSSVVGRRLYLSTYLSIYLPACLPAYVRHSAKRRLADSLVVVVTCELAVRRQSGRTNRGRNYLFAPFACSAALYELLLIIATIPRKAHLVHVLVKI